MLNDIFCSNFDQTYDVSYAPSDEDNKIRRRFTPRSPPPIAKGGEDTPFENCVKKRRVGTTNATLYAPFYTVVTSVTSPLAKGGSTDEDGERKPAPVTVKIEGSERGEEEGTASAANTTAPAQLSCHDGGACCKCRYQSYCKTTWCACRRAGRNCVSCWCLVWCANVAPQTRQDEQLRPARRQAHHVVLQYD